jgi:methionyl-tRNA formyltransferase
VRVAFLGTPDAAVPPLRALAEHGHDVALVVSRADARRGRGGALTPSPVKAAALELGLSVTDRVDDLVTLEPPAELGVVVAFGRIIRPPVLAVLPMVNLHFSLLPRWRGAAPVERAILAGDTRTGVCLMAVEEGLDTGGVYRRAEVDIGPTESAAALRARLVTIGTRLLVDALAEGLGPPDPQVGEPTYASKIEPHELAIDVEGPAEQAGRVVRVGGAWTTFRGRRLKIWAADVVDGGPPAGALDGLDIGCASGALRLVEVQPEGRGRMAASDWARGTKPRPGERVGVDA